MKARFECGHAVAKRFVAPRRKALKYLVMVLTLQEKSMDMPRGPSPFTMPMLRYARDPDGFYAACARRYGDCFTSPTPFGPVVVTGHPNGARQIFAADPDTFLAEILTPFLGAKSVILLSGQEHRRERKLLMPPFQGDRMRAYGDGMIAATRRVVDALFGARPAGVLMADAPPFKMLEVTQRIALDIMIEAVLGIDVGEEPVLAHTVREAVFGHVNCMKPEIVFFPALRRPFLGYGPWSRFIVARDILDRLIYKLIDRRMKLEPREDILSLMLRSRYDDGGQMAPREIRDELIALLFAGHETTAIATAWAMYWLHRTPGALDALQVELYSELGANLRPEIIAKLPYLEAICNESLRVHPVVVDVPRTLAQPFELCGYHLEPGVTVSASALLIHRREDLYPDAKTFRPSRWLGERRYTPAEFIPFGGGARRCLGAAFAMYEMKIVLATLLRCYRFRRATATEEVPRRRGFVMAPGNGVEMMFT